MKYIQNYEQFITESINQLYENFTVKNNILYFNSSSKELNINTTLGKKNFMPRVTSIPEFNLKIYTAYSKSKEKENSQEVRNILNTLKRKGPYTMDEKSYKIFLSRTAIFFYRLLQYEKIDVILTVESSSGISNDLKNEILKHFPYKSLVFDEGIKKNLEFATYVVEDSNLNPTTLKSLQHAVKKSQDTGYFKIQKIQPQFRKFIKNWLKVDDEIREKIPGKNILIIDDFLTSGSTLYETARLLKELGALNLICITIIK